MSDPLPAADPAADRALLQRFEPVVRYTRGERSTLAVRQHPRGVESDSNKAGFRSWARAALRDAIELHDLGT